MPEKIMNTTEMMAWAIKGSDGQLVSSDPRTAVDLWTGRDRARMEMKSRYGCKIVRVRVKIVEIDGVKG